MEHPKTTEPFKLASQKTYFFSEQGQKPETPACKQDLQI